MDMDLWCIEAIDSAAMASELRKRLGAKFLIQRAQEMDWSRLEAGKRAGIDSGTVRRIELGQNYKMDALEAYAVVLGKSLEDWLWDVLSEMRREADLNRHTAVPNSPTVAAGSSRSANKEDGRRIASGKKTPSVAQERSHGETRSVSCATRVADSRAFADLERLTREAERAGGLARSARAAGAVGEHAAASSVAAPSSSPSPRKCRG